MWSPSPLCAGGGGADPCYAQVEKLLVERNSQRSIVRVTGGARITVAKLIKKAPVACPPLPRLRPKKAQHQEWKVLKLDERWTFVGQRRRRAWRWLAVEHARRRIVAWVMGRRDAATTRRLWQALPRRYRRHYWYFTDLFPACVSVLPRWHHRRCPKGTGGTNIVEVLHCSLRQRCGVLVRRSYSFSKSICMHEARIKIVIDNYNATLN